MKIKVFVVVLASCFLSYKALSQNINTATNGLTKSGSTVSLGGTLTSNTSIDLGTFWFRLIKNNQQYLSVINNGNVGIGVANPLSRLHAAGSIRFDTLAGVGNRMVIVDGNGVLGTQAIPGGGGGTPGGANTYIQYNNNGAFGGEAAFVWNSTTKSLDILGAHTITGQTDKVQFSVKAPASQADQSDIFQILSSGGEKMLGVGKHSNYTYFDAPYGNGKIWFKQGIGLGSNSSISNVNAGGEIRFESDGGMSIRPSFQENISAQFYSSGAIQLPKLATNLTAPATTGTTRMVVTDQNGFLSFDTIPGSSATGTATLQQVTDAGNSSTNKIISSGYILRDGTTDYLENEKVSNGIGQYAGAIKFRSYTSHPISLFAPASTNNRWLALPDEDDTLATRGFVRSLAGNGGGSSSRFGVTGEDATASQARAFSLNGNQFTVEDLNNTSNTWTRFRQRNATAQGTSDLYPGQYTLSVADYPNFDYESYLEITGGNNAHLNFFTASPNAGQGNNFWIDRDSVYFKKRNNGQLNFQLKGLPNNTTSSVVYYNNSTGQLTYGAPSSSLPTLQQVLTTGNTATDLMLRMTTTSGGGNAVSEIWSDGVRSTDISGQRYVEMSLGDINYQDYGSNSYYSTLRFNTPTANRLLHIPDESDTLATRAFVRNLAIGSSSSYSFSNGLTNTGNTIRLGGSLSQQMDINGQGNAFNLENLSQFKVRGSNTDITGDRIDIQDYTGTSLGLRYNGIFGTTVGGNIEFKAGQNKESFLGATIGTGYAGSLINNGLVVDQTAARMGTYTFNGSGSYEDQFRFQLQGTDAGRVFLPRYGNSGVINFNDAPTRKALYIDSATGKLLYGDIDVPTNTFLNGLTSTNGTTKLGGSLTENTTLTLSQQNPNANKYYRIEYDDPSGGDGSKEFGVSMYGTLYDEDGVYHGGGQSYIYKSTNQTSADLNISTNQNGWGNQLYMAQEGVNNSYLELRNAASNTNHQNKIILDSAGIQLFSRKPWTNAAKRFWIKNGGELKAEAYPYSRNDGTATKFLTTDSAGNVQFKSVDFSAATPAYTFSNGLTKSGNNVSLGGAAGDIFLNSTGLFSSKANLHSFSSGDNNVNTTLGIAPERQVTTAFSTQLGQSDNLIEPLQIVNKSGILAGPQNNYQYPYGLSTHLTPDSFSVNTEVYNTQYGFVGGPSLMRLNSQGELQLKKYLNNTSEDSLLTTDINGNLKFKSISSVAPSVLYSGGLRKIDSTVSLGGPLTGFTEIQTGPHTFVTGNENNYISISPSASNLISGNSITGTSAGISANGTTASLLGEVKLNNFPSSRNNGTATKFLTTDSLGNLQLKNVDFGSNQGSGIDSTKWSSDNLNVFNKNIGNVGIGTTIPTAKFHTLGSMRFESFKNNEQADSVLTTDTEGNLKMVYMPYGSGGGSGASYTFENGVTQANGHVNLGGTLLDSVRLNLNGQPFNFNSGTNRVLSLIPNGSFDNGKANYDLTANAFKFNVGSKMDSVGGGNQLWFNGNGNSDGLWMSRYNASADASELRMNIGDDGGSADKLNIGYFPYNGGGWKSTFVAQANGQAGIGTSEISGDLSLGTQHGDKITIGNNAWANKTIIATGNDAQTGDYTELRVPGSQANSAYLRLNKEGSIGIGTTKTDAGYKLLVNGRVKAVGLRVQAASSWPDYVFDSVYWLRPLSEVEKFIKSNKHLPELPTALQVEKEGIDVSETQIKLLQKIEELTLYIIDQDKRVKDLEEKNKNLEDQNKKINQVQQELEDLKKLILKTK